MANSNGTHFIPTVSNIPFLKPRLEERLETIVPDLVLSDSGDAVYKIQRQFVSIHYLCYASRLSTQIRSKFIIHLTGLDRNEAEGGSH